MNSAIKVPPKPKPSRTSYARSPYAMKINVPPSKPRPSVNIPVIVPVRYPTWSASPNEVRAAAATRKLPSVAKRIPTNPTAKLKSDPIRNAMARPTATGIGSLNAVKNSTIVRIPINTTILRNC